MQKKPVRPEARPFDPLLRYCLEDAASYLQISRAHAWKKVKAGDIRVIRDGRRVFVPGSEIARLSSVPQ